MYYSDKELLEMVETLQVRTKLEREKKHDVVEMLRERFEQKDKQLKFTSDRLQEAANIIGHNTINECMMYE